MTALLALIKGYLPGWAIKALLVTVAVAVLLFGYHLWANHQQQIGYDRAIAEVNADKLKRIAVADAITEGWKSLYQEAEDARAQTIQKNTVLAAGNARALSDLGRMRRDLDAERARRMSEISAETCTATARTLDAVFGECAERIERLAGRYGEVARAAAGHQADAEMMDRAWPAKQ